MSEKGTLFERIGRFFTSLTDRIYRGIAQSPIGRFFSAYPAANRYFRSSAAVSIADMRHGPAKDLPLRRGMARAVDGSFLRRATHMLVDGICRCSLRAIGTFLVTTGIYCGIIAWLIGTVWQEGVPSGFRLYGALGLAVIGALFLFSENSVAYALENSFLPHWVMHNALGFSEDALKDVPQTGKKQYAVAIPLGMLLGTLIALVDPLLLLAVAAVIAVVLAIFATPEAGILLLIVAAPFYGLTAYGRVLIVLGAFFVLLSYLFKLLRGTRVFRLELQDLIVLLLLVYTAFVGIKSGVTGGFSVLPLLLLTALYFPAVNMLSTPHWLVRARWAVMAAATAAGVVGIWQFVFAAVMAYHGAGEITMMLLGRAVCAGFSDHAALAYFLVLSFPFSLHAFLRAKPRHRMPAGFACVAIIAAVALTWVQSAWIAIAVELVVFFLLYERRVFPYFVIAALILPALYFFVPAAVRTQLGELLYATSDISSVRTDIGGALAARIFLGDGGGFFGRGAGILRLFFGLGYGGLESVAVLYTDLPTAEIVSSLRFWTYRLIEGGILGVLLPAVLLLLLLQNFFSLLSRATRKSITVAPVCAIATVFGVIAMSVFRYFWQDPMALMLFFVLIGVLSADARNRRVAELAMAPVMQSADNASLEYRPRPMKRHERIQAELAATREKLYAGAEESLFEKDASEVPQAAVSEEQAEEEQLEEKDAVSTEQTESMDVGETTKEDQDESRED